MIGIIADFNKVIYGNTRKMGIQVICDSGIIDITTKIIILESQVQSVPSMVQSTSQ
jgi:hypothetical protein